MENDYATIAAAGAGGVPWLLAALGVIAAAVATERAAALHRTRGDTAELRAELGRTLGQSDLVGARMCVVGSSTVEANVVAAGLAALPRGAASVEERMASETKLARLTLERGLTALGIVASTAPLLGLLGAVLHVACAAPTATCNASSLLERGGALGVAAAGLAIAIPASATAKLLRSRIAARITRAEALGRYVLSFLKDERRSLEREATRAL